MCESLSALYTAGCKLHLSGIDCYSATFFDDVRQAIEASERLVAETLTALVQVMAY